MGEGFPDADLVIETDSADVGLRSRRRSAASKSPAIFADTDWGARMFTVEMPAGAGRLAIFSYQDRLARRQHARRQAGCNRSALRHGGSALQCVHHRAPAGRGRGHAAASRRRSRRTSPSCAFPARLKFRRRRACWRKPGSYDAIICLGCLIRGETAHYEVIANEVDARHRAVGAGNRRAARLRRSDLRYAGAGDRPRRAEGRQQGLRRGAGGGGDGATEIGRWSTVDGRRLSASNLAAVACATQPEIDNAGKQEQDSGRRRQVRSVRVDSRTKPAIDHRPRPRQHGFPPQIPRTAVADAVSVATWASSRRAGAPHLLGGAQRHGRRGPRVRREAVSAWPTTEPGRSTA